MARSSGKSIVPVLVLSLLLALTAVAPPALAGPSDPVVHLELAPGAELERLAVRSGGRQTRLSIPSGVEPKVAAPADACALVLATVRSGAGAPGATSSTKTVACPALDGPDPAAAARARIDAAGMLLGKTGDRVEIRPLTNPATLRPGKALALRLYADGPRGAGERVTLRDADGHGLDAWTDPSGVVVFEIPAAGRWTVAYRPLVDGHPGADGAELAFDVAPAAVWEPLLAELRRQEIAQQVAAAALPLAAGGAGQSELRHRSVATPRWQPLGPAPIDGVEYAGRIAALAVSPSRPNRYVVGAASGGVWTTESGGASWRERGDELPFLSIGAVAVDPHDESVIYAGSGESHGAYHSLYGVGLYKSEDGGRTWRVLAEETFRGRTISRIAVSPVDPATVWATVVQAGGTFDLEGAKLHPDRFGPLGLFRSDDAGETWTHVTGTVPAIAAHDVEIDPLDPNRIWVAFGERYGDPGNGFYLSMDGGATFQRRITFMSLGRSEPAVAPSDSNRVYGLVGTGLFALFDWGGYLPPGGSTHGVWRSDDGGLTWQYFYPGNVLGGQGNYDAAIAVHPDDPDTVFVGGVTLARSRDAGATWEDVTPPHVDIHQIAFDAAGRLVVATDGGVYRSDDLGETWEARNRHLGTIQLYPGLSTAVDPSARRGAMAAMAAGTQDNGTVLSDRSGRNWRMVLGGDGGFTSFTAADPDVLFAEFQGPDGLFRSDDRGITFEQLAIPLDVFDITAFQAAYQVDPNDPERLLYATQRIFESTDLGETWTAISDYLTVADPNVSLVAVRSLAIAPSDSSTVYATTNEDRLLVSTDGGATWSESRTGVYGWTRILRQVAVDPAEAAVAVAAIGGFGTERVIATFDRGASWTAIGAGLPDVPVNTVAVARVGGVRWLLAGTDRGVWASSDDGATWQVYGRGLPHAPVMDLLVDEAGHRLVASTLGRGVWQSVLVGR